MRFAPLFATLCAFASIASAAPLVAPPAEEKRLLNLGGLLSNPKVTQLQTIVTGLDSQTAPVLTKIQSLVATPALTNQLLTSLGGGPGSVSLAGLQGLVSGLSGTLPAGQVTSITTALTNLGNVSPQLYSLIQQILTALIKISTAQAAIQQLVSSGGTTGLLASLTNTGTIVTKLTSLLSTLFLTINKLNTQLAAALAKSSTDVTKLNAALQALQAPIDTSTAQVVSGSNAIISGLTTLVRAALALVSALKAIVNVGGSAGSLSGLLSGLGLSSIKSALGL